MGKNKSKKPKAKPTAPDPAHIGPVPKASSPRSPSSPFYPAVNLPGPAQLDPKPTAESPEPSLAFRETMKPKDHRKVKMAASWSAKAAAVLVPAILSGFSSYQSSKSDSESGYTATLEAVKELQEATKELVKQQAYLQGQVDSIQGQDEQIHGIKRKRIAPPPELKKTVVLSALPTDLGSAVKGKGRLMEQQSYSLAPPPESVFDVNERATLADAMKKRAAAITEMEKARAAALAKKEEAAAARDRAAAVVAEPPPPPPTPVPPKEIPEAPAAPAE